MKLTVVGCSPAWPNPGGAQSGYLLDGSGKLLLDCGPGVLARLREGEAAGPQRRCDRDHALPPRPLGRPRAVGMGPDVRARTRRSQGRSVAAARRPRRAAGLRRATSARLDVRAGRSSSTSTWRARPSRRPGTSSIRSACRTTRCSRSAFASRTASARLPTRATRAERRARRASPATSTSSSARRRSNAASSTASRAGHLSADEAVASYEASGARRLLLTHRPRELVLADGLEQAYDGLELTV